MRIEVNKVIYFNALQSKRKMDRKLIPFLIWKMAILGEQQRETENSEAIDKHLASYG